MSKCTGGSNSNAMCSKCNAIFSPNHIQQTAKQCCTTPRAMKHRQDGSLGTSNCTAQCHILCCLAVLCHHTHCPHRNTPHLPVPPPRPNMHVNKHHYCMSTGTSCRLHPQPTQYYILNMRLMHTLHNDIACLHIACMCSHWLHLSHRHSVDGRQDG